jgi:hypothetical protein
MFDFIKKELVEARLFRSPDDLDGLAGYDIANLIFASFLILEMMRHDDHSLALSYVNRTMQFKDFDHMRGGTTDLANMIAVLSNQSDYEDHLNPTWGLTSPQLQITAYLRGWGFADESRIRQFLLKLGEDLRIFNSDLSSARRIVSKWKHATHSEKHSAWSNINRLLNKHAVQLDLYKTAHSIFPY